MSDADAPADQKLPRRVQSKSVSHRIVHGAGTAALTLLLVAGVMLAAAGLYLREAPINAPPWVRAKIENRIAQELPQAQVSFGEMVFVMDDGWRPRVRLRDVVVKTLAGQEIIRFNEFKATLAARPLLDGQVQPKEILLSGIFANLRRDVQSFAVSGGHNASAPAREAASLPQLIGQMDAVLQSPALSALQTVELRAVTLRYTDLNAQRAWTADGGRARLLRDGDDLTLAADIAILSGGAGVATLAANYTSRIGETEASFGVSFDGVAAGDIAAQGPAFAWLDVLRAPISGAVRSGLAADGRFEPLNATLQIGAGVVQPNDETKPIPFDGARSYFSYAPQDRLLRFDALSVKSAWISGEAAGSATLGVDPQTGQLTDLVAQIQLTDLSANPGSLYEEPIDLTGADADFRLELDPFRISLGRLQIRDHSKTLLVQGSLQADPKGWRVAVDGQMDGIVPTRLLALWPKTLVPKTRKWLTENILGGQINNIDMALRRAPELPQQTYLAFDYSEASVRFMRHMPPIEKGKGHFSLTNNRMVVALDGGQVTPPAGGVVALAGSSFILPDIRIRGGPPSVIRLKTRSSVIAALSILNQKPLSVLDKARLPVALAAGQAVLTGTLAVPLKRGAGLKGLDFHFSGELTNLDSDVLVRNRSVKADRLEIVAESKSVQIKGRGQIDGVPFEGAWTQPIGPGATQGTVTGDVVLSGAALETFGVKLPDGTVTGTAPARVHLDIERGKPVRFALNSDLQGVRVAVPQISWQKPAGQAGHLEVAGQLGKTPRVDLLKLSGLGLQATGRVALTETGGLERVRFDDLRVGNWLNAPVDLVGQGVGNPVQVVLRGGSIDLRQLDTDIGVGAPTTGPPAPPMQVALDRLQITDTIALTDMIGVFQTARGLDGTFQAKLNGGTPVEGRIVPLGGRSAVRLVSSDAGGVLRSAGLLKQIVGGQLQLVLRPVGQGGNFEGELNIRDVRVKNAPGIAGLLNAISVVGLINELNGDGIYFDTVDGKFLLTPNRLTLTEGSAVGASMGLSMDGDFALDSGLIAMQGVITPVYLLNGIGSVLTRRGEGLIGFNYTLKGLAKAPSVSVNPLSALAPGMFRDIFRTQPRPPTTGTRNDPDAAPQKPVVRSFEGR